MDDLEHRWWHVLQATPGTGRTLYHYQHLCYFHGTREGALLAGDMSSGFDPQAELRAEPLTVHYLLRERARLEAALAELNGVQKAMEGEGH